MAKFCTFCLSFCLIAVSEGLAVREHCMKTLYEDSSKEHVLEETINGYILTEPFQNRNAGFSRWTFAKKDGRRFFLKEFLSPVYPLSDSIGQELMEKGRQACGDYERKSIEIYQAVNSAYDGNLVRVESFFRHGAHYYIAMEQVPSLPMKVEGIAHLPVEERIALCRTLAHSVACLHKKGIVHADIKSTNVLIKKTVKGTLTTKLIDYDCCFSVSDPPKKESELNGDQVYLSPEACRFIFGEEVPLTTKMDVFSLGILFHEYLTGNIPGFDHEEYDYLHEAVLDGQRPVISSSIPEKYREMLLKMLLEDPSQRCSMQEVCDVLRPESLRNQESSWFMAPGDL